MSITLTTGKLVAINGVTQENDNAGAATLLYVDWVNNTAVFTLGQGSVSGSNFTVGAYGDQITVTVNLISGKWQASNGQTGTIGAGPLGNFVSQMKAIRNTFESFASGSIMPGTPVAW